MRVTAAELHAFGLVDEVVAEPVPANEAQHATMVAVGDAIARNLDDLLRTYPLHEPAAIERMLEDRYQKFRKMGVWRENLQRQHGLPVDAPSLAQ
jgi:acetyl-CoA carboxylase alpha subunit